MYGVNNFQQLEFDSSQFYKFIILAIVKKMDNLQNGYSNVENTRNIKIITFKFIAKFQLTKIKGPLLPLDMIQKNWKQNRIMDLLTEPSQLVFQTFNSKFRH